MPPGIKALENLATHSPQLVISDLRMDKVGGLDILRECREVLPQTPVILITAYKTVETAIEAMKLGAYDYITKPFKVDELQLTIQRALDNQTLVRENRNLRQIVKEKYRFENIIGTSARMQEIYNLIAKVADTDSTILIQGESGTGKELVARALHFNSTRQHQPFVAINCSALPENLLESELFGHKKGAFTGAVQDKIGLFEEAELGTIFLDEVNSMAQPLQTKLLRVLQERQIRRVGDTKTVPINVRVLAATNESLGEKIKGGNFREDLYYRLAVIPIEMPACASAWMTSRCSSITSCKRTPRRPAPSQRRSIRKRWRCSGIIAGRAMCANWRTPSNGPARSAMTASSGRPIFLRRSSAKAPRRRSRAFRRAARGPDTRRIHSRTGAALHRRDDQVQCQQPGESREDARHQYGDPLPQARSKIASGGSENLAG